MANEYFYEYVWDIVFNIPARNIGFRPYSLIEFRKSCNYFGSFIPAYSMVCKIEDQYLDLLRTLDKEMKVTVKQYMFSGTDKNNLSDKELISEDVFAVYYEKGSIPSFSANSKTVTEDVTSIQGDRYQPGEPTKLALAKLNFNLLLIKDLKMKTHLHNYVLGSEDKPVSPISAVKFCIEENPYIDKCIIDPPDNTDVYTDLIVEPNELKDAIKMIQYRYGIYSKALTLFYDNGVLYVLNRLESYHSFQKDEISKIYVLIDDRISNVNPVDCAVINTKHNFIKYERATSFSKQDYESIEGILKGDKFVYSNFNSVLNSGFGNDGDTTFISPLQEVDKPRSSRKDIGTKKILDYDMLNNPFNMSSIMHEQSIGVPINFMLKSVNCHHFTPNKNLQINFTTPQSRKLYAGIYNIANVDFIYTTAARPSARFTTFGHAVLTVVNKIEGFDKDYEVIDGT